MAELVITGLGVISALGHGQAAVTQGLLAGEASFAVMQRPGRQLGDSAFLGAELAQFEVPSVVSPRLARTASLSTLAALTVVEEAWDQARLSMLPGERIGIVIGGSNFQQRELDLLRQDYQQRPQFLPPSYAQRFMDSDLWAACCEVFGIRSLAYGVAGASASGQLAVIHAAQAVLADQVDACIAVGALMDLSYWECQGFRSMGAMGSDRYADQPQLACRPFDQGHDGFIFGESSGAVVIERAERARVAPWARMLGWSVKIDGQRGPEPSLNGEIEVMRNALVQAQLDAAAIDYINPHGTGSPGGDATELQALQACGLNHAWINTTKSILGHGLTSAGTVELIATLLQMKVGTLHPSRNLQQPIDVQHSWVGDQSVAHQIEHALCLSYGFGGINTALCVQRCAW